MDERYRLTIDGGTDNAFVKEYTKDELKKKQKHIANNYGGRFQIDVVQDADTSALDDNQSYTVKIDDNWQKDYTGAELKTKLNHLNENYSGRYRVETSTMSYTDMDSLFAPKRKQLEDFALENGEFLSQYEDWEELAQRPGMQETDMQFRSDYEEHIAQTPEYNAKKRQLEALKKEYYTSDEYLTEQEEWGKVLSSMRDSIDKGRLEFAQANPMIEGYNPSATRGAEADKELQMYETAGRIIDNTIKLHNAPSKYQNTGLGNMLRGAGDKTADVDLWTAGLTEMTDNLGVRDVLKSVQDKLGSLNDLSEETIEEILTPAEKAVLQAWSINAQEQLKRISGRTRSSRVSRIHG